MLAGLLQHTDRREQSERQQRRRNIPIEEHARLDSEGQRASQRECRNRSSRVSRQQNLQQRDRSEHHRRVPVQPQRS